jgi:hypothetical protein
MQLPARPTPNQSLFFRTLLKIVKYMISLKCLTILVLLFSQLLAQSTTALPPSILLFGEAP